MSKECTYLIVQDSNRHLKKGALPVRKTDLVEANKI